MQKRVLSVLKLNCEIVVSKFNVCGFFLPGQTCELSNTGLVSHLDTFKVISG